MEAQNRGKRGTRCTCVVCARTSDLLALGCVVDAAMTVYRLSGIDTPLTQEEYDAFASARELLDGLVAVINSRLAGN